jgi:hypothetical protein
MVELDLPDDDCINVEQRFCSCRVNAKEIITVRILLDKEN